MTILELKNAMESIQSISGVVGEYEVERLCSEQVKRFLKGKENISRHEFLAIEKYVVRENRQCVTVEEELKAEAARKVDELNSGNKKLPELYVTTQGTPIKRTGIYRIPIVNFQDILFKSLEKNITDDIRYQLFKSWFFEEAVYRADCNNCFFVNIYLWNLLNDKFPDFIERLKEESRIAFRMSDENMIEYRKKQIYRELESKLLGMTEEEKKKEIKFSYGGRIVRIVD